MVSSSIVSPPASYFPEAPVDPPKDNILWRGIKVTFNFFYETPAVVIGVTIAAIASHFFIPVLAPTLYTLAVTSMISKLVVKLCGRLNYKFLAKVESSAWNFKVKYPRIQTIAIIITIAAGYILPWCGVILALALGVYSGIINEIEYYKKMQKVTKEAQETMRHEIMHLIIE